ncbi:MAG: esterase family protein [Ruminococcaceae bacterium]|nr:esterase family protein [Oscillospiraceae bacterium]
MAFIQFHFFSEALGMQSEAYVIIPQRKTSGQIGVESQSSNEKYKCLYLLHGLSDDHTIWMRRTSIERYADKYGICVVMPCAHRSFYSNMDCGLKYYDYIAHELPSLICEFFNVSSRREDNFVAGLSMGGYGALKIALRDPDKFCAGAGLSAVTDVKSPYRKEFLSSIFGKGNSAPDEDDLFLLADNCANNPNRPKLFMACGTEDGLYPENVRLRDTLNSLGYDLFYTEEHGNHNWEFWDKHIQGVLEWMFT